MSAHDWRAKWDRLLDQAPPDWQAAAREVGDTVAIAASILRHECGWDDEDAANGHESVVEVARMIIARRDRAALLAEVDEAIGSPNADADLGGLI